MRHPADFLSWPSFILIALNIAVECAVLIRSSIRPQNKLTMLPVYAGFRLLADAVGVLFLFFAPVTAANGIFYQSKPYWLWYWSTTVVSNILLALLAIEIVTVLMVGFNKMLVFWGCWIMTVILAIAYQALPTGKTSDVLSIVTTADIICATALLALCLSGSFLRKPLRLPIAGTVLSVGLEFGLSIIRVMTGLRYYKFLVLAFPMASLIGMICFLMATCLHVQKESSANPESLAI